MTTLANAWPALDLATWAPTKKSLHLYAQMLGKLRLALAPHQPNFLFTALALTTRGFATGTMPHGAGSLDVCVDVYDAQMRLTSSDGRVRSISLVAPQTIARVFAALHEALRELDVDVTLSPVPQEVPDLTPLDRDERPAIFEQLDAQRWLRVVTAVHVAFDRWRAHFFGRTGIALWWGAFDYAVLLFSGNHVPAPTNRGYLLRYDLDAEMMNAGFYPGDDTNAAYFYGYIYPQPAACATTVIAPEAASWSDSLGEWVLPYEAVRSSPDPERAVAAFLDAIYDACGSSSGWDRARYTYTPPPLRRGPKTA